MPRKNQLKSIETIEEPVTLEETEESSSDEEVMEKTKRPRTEAQIKAFEKALQKRKENSEFRKTQKIKEEEEFAKLKAEKQKKKELKETKKKQLELKKLEVDSSSDEEEIIMKKRKPKKKVIYVDDDEDDRDKNIVIINKMETTPKTVPKSTATPSKSIGLMFI